MPDTLVRRRSSFVGTTAATVLTIFKFISDSGKMPRRDFPFLRGCIQGGLINCHYLTSRAGSSGATPCIDPKLTVL